MKKVPFGTIMDNFKQKIPNLKSLSLLTQHKRLIISVLAFAVVGGAVFTLWPKHQVQPVAKPPELSVNQPKYVNDQTMVISGQTDPGNTVLVDGSPVQVQPDGGFKVTYTGTIVSKIMRVVADNTTGLESVDELDIIPPDVSSRDSLPKIPVAAAQDDTSSTPAYTPPPTTSTSQKPSLPKMSSQAGGYNPVVTSNKNVPKPYLTLSAPAKTNKSQVEVSGYGVPGATVIINGSISVTVGTDARYSSTVKLADFGPNEVTATESYKDWGYREVTKQISITYVIAPYVTVRYLDRYNNKLLIPDSTSAAYLNLNIAIQDADLHNGVMVTIGAQPPVKSDTGSMSYRWDLVSGTNSLKITVTDDFGNSTVQTFTVKH